MSHEMNTLQGQFQNANYLQPLPLARCGHIAVVVDKLNDFGTELVVIHGGINAQKEAQSDLSVLQVANEQWLELEPSPVGPAARAFHAACGVASGTVYIFAGHVYLTNTKRLHHFNDLWQLNTDTWQWHRLDASPDAPSPPPRDRSSLIALDEHRLLVYGGADASNKRLDDAWVYDLRKNAWKEVVISSGAKPRARCSTAIFSFSNRVLIFGGDTGSGGPSNELWSLRGVHEGDGGGVEPPQWTQLLLQLEGGGGGGGSVPAPRRGHSVAPAEVLGGVLFVGGLSEQKSLLGIKKQSEYLMDGVVLQRQRETLVWRQVEMMQQQSKSGGGNGGGGGGGDGEDGDVPLPREKHTVCALKDGRFFLFGGTDGLTTLGDAWWLMLEDVVAPPPPDLIALSTGGALLQQPPFALPPPPSLPPTSTSTTPLPPPQSLLVSPPPNSNAAVHESTTPPPPSPSPSPSSYWGALPSSLQAVVPTIATSALTSLKGRLGYYPGDGPFSPAPAPITATHTNNSSSSSRTAPIGNATEDAALLAIGRSALGVDSTSDAIVHAAREYFSTVSPTELRLGEVAVLMTDYKRLARIGWSMAVSALGVDALGDEDVLLLGRYVMWSVDDVRMRDIEPILEDYKSLLLAAAAVGVAARAEAVQNGDRDGDDDGGAATGGMEEEIENSVVDSVPVAAAAVPSPPSPPPAAAAAEKQEEDANVS